MQFVPGKTNLKWVPNKQVSLHERVTPNTVARLAGTIYQLTQGTLLTADALHLLLLSHPAIVIKKRTGEYACIAGLRSFQLAKSRLPPDQKIPVTIVEDVLSKDVRDFAASETYLTHLMYGLGGKAWDIGFARLWEGIDSYILSKLTPDLKDKSKLANHLGSNRRRLSSSPPPLKSQLKQTLCASDSDE